MEKQKIWRAIPIEMQDEPYVDRLMALSENFIRKNGSSMYRFPKPESDFEFSSLAST